MLSGKHYIACFLILILRIGPGIREYTDSRPRQRRRVFGTGLERKSRHWKSQRTKISDGRGG